MPARRKKRVFTVLSLISLLWLVTTSDGANILLIGEPDAPAMGDPFVIDRLEELGHNVTFAFGLDITGPDVAAFDLLVMSSTNLTSNIRDNEFETIPQPILTWESSMVRAVPGEFWISEEQQSGDLGSFITVADSSHPVMAGLGVTDGEELEIFSEDQNLFGLTGEIAPGATVVAVGAEPCCSEDRTMIVDLPAGAQTLPGSEFPDDLSPGHRLFLMISDTSFEFLNEAGIQIFDNAIDYLLGNSQQTPGDFNQDGTLDAADIDALTSQVASASNDPLFDLNEDSKVDTVDIELWVKDLFGSWIGDTNLDGEFNSSDLVAMLASGTYENDVQSVWSTGDLNGDGRTNSSDLVAGLADGGYELGPQAAVSAVPEPASLVLFALGLVGLRGVGIIRRREFRQIRAFVTIKDR